MARLVEQSRELKRALSSGNQKEAIKLVVEMIASVAERLDEAQQPRNP